MRRVKSMHPLLVPTSKLAEKRTVLRRQKEKEIIIKEFNEEIVDIRTAPEFHLHTDVFCVSKTDEKTMHDLDISTAHAILSYMEEHYYYKNKIRLEWQELCDAIAMSADKVNGHCQSSTEIFLDNEHCNIDQLANFITDYNQQCPQYLISPGPSIDNLTQFWQKLIWDNNCTVIVNLSCIKEEDVKFYGKYWPDEAACIYGDIRVHLVSEHVCCDEYIVRSLYVRHLPTMETRTVTQFHYIAWPNDGVPVSFSSFLYFQRKVNKCFRDSSSPLLVHCSDGLGRSGVFVLIDMIFKRVSKGIREFNLASTLQHIRDQRPGLICTEKQYAFALACVAEELKETMQKILCYR